MAWHAHRSHLQTSAAHGGKGTRIERGSGLVSIASLSPVGSAKFGPRVGAEVVGARVGGLVSPTLVGAGVPVGTVVGAAHTIA
jgi:hypothetical protein